MGGDIEDAIAAGETAIVADAAAQELKAGRGAAEGACANCGATLVGPHCHVCGQVADDMHRPLLALLHEALEGLFSLDGRFLKTVPALVVRPGAVSARYLQGARARFVQPFRLYLFSAVIFLLAVSIVTGDWTDIDFDDPGPGAPTFEEIERELSEAAEEAAASGDPAAAGLERAREGVAAARSAAESGEAADVVRLEQRRNAKCAFRREILPEEPDPGCPEAEDDSPSDSPVSDGSVSVDLGEGLRSWPIGVRRHLVRQADTIIDDPSRFFEAVNRWISRVLIGLFPVYALLLGLMHFWKRRFFFYDHIVVSLHFHAFLFLLLTLLIAASVVVPVWLLCLVFVGWSNYALYKTHRLVYGCGRFTSALRTLTLDFLYFIILMFVPVLLVITGFLTA